MTIGLTDMKQVIQIPADWDLSYMRRWALADGATFDQLVSNVAAALLLFNRSLTAGYYAQYLQTTTEMAMEYDTGGEGGSELEKISEYTRPDPLRGATTGHMIPMHDYGGALGWTYMALRRGTMSKLETGIRRLIERSENTWNKRILERLFKSTSETIGTSGQSHGFADGGVGDANYIPLSYAGRTFANTHNHYLRNTDDASGRTAYMLAAMGHMYEHGILGPYELIVPEADVALWAAQTEFVKPTRAYLATAGVEKRAIVDEMYSGGSEYIGIVETAKGWARVRPEPRLPVDYAGMFKPTGFNNTFTPLAVRYEPGYPLGLALVGRVDAFPLQEAVAYFTFGVGVANRLAGVPGYFAANGAYTDPTIS